MSFADNNKKRMLFIEQIKIEYEKIEIQKNIKMNIYYIMDV